MEYHPWEPDTGGAWRLRRAGRGRGRRKEMEGDEGMEEEGRWRRGREGDGRR